MNSKYILFLSLVVPLGAAAQQKQPAKPLETSAIYISGDADMLTIPWKDIDAETSFLLNIHFGETTALSACRLIVRKDGYIHSIIYGQEYVQTCKGGKLGILLPKWADGSVLKGAK